MLHNHPLGDPKLSRNDIGMTREIAKAAETLSNSLHDHLVIEHQGHTSFQNLGPL